jgi:hypothetical protein
VNVPQREFWSGEPAELGELFRLHKLTCNRQLEAVCRLVTHEFGWECRLTVGDDLLRSEVCRTRQAVTACGEQWKAAMIEKGWR